MTAKERIFPQLPEAFSRQTFLDTACEIGISYSYATLLLQQATKEKIIKRVERGLYRKIQNPVTA